MALPWLIGAAAVALAAKAFGGESEEEKRERRRDERRDREREEERSKQRIAEQIKNDKNAIILKDIESYKQESVERMKNRYNVKLEFKENKSANSHLFGFWGGVSNTMITSSEAYITHLSNNAITPKENEIKEIEQTITLLQAGEYDSIA